MKDAPEGERPTRRRLLAWAGWALVTALVVVAFRRLDWARAGEAILEASLPWMALAVAANGGILLLWAAQWRVLLPRGSRVSFGRMFGVTAVMSSVANGGPVLAGQVTGVHLLATRGGVGYARAVSVAALDQLAEGIAKVGLIGLVALVTPLPPEVRPAVASLAVGVALLGTVLLVAARRHDAADLPLAGAARTGVLGRGWDVLLRAAGHLDALRSPRAFGAALLLAGAMKGAELGGILAAQAALGIEVGAPGSLLVLASVALATMLTVTPANLGVYEAAAFGAYRLLGVEPASALALAVLQHLLFLIPAAGTGWLLLTLRRVGVHRDPGPG